MFEFCFPSILVLSLVVFARGDDHVEVRADLTEAISTTTESYASFNVDSSFNRGFFHVNFTNENLIAAARSLQPATLRFGGSGNDLLVYGTPINPCNASKLEACTTTWSTTEEGACCMNTSQWHDFEDFSRAIGSELLFGVSFDLVAACKTGSSYVWSDRNVRDFFEHVLFADGPPRNMYGFELGNEVNNNEIHCNLTALQQARAFRDFADLLDDFYPDRDEKSRPYLVGPDTGYLNSEAWLRDFFSNISAYGPRIHAGTHHVYPGVTLQNWNLSSTLDKVLNDVSWYVPLLHASGVQIFAGEEGPKGGGENGTCGGHEVSACGTFATVPWYADDMALRASKGFVQFQRQDLIGARYGLIGIQHDNEDLDSSFANR
eukprot:g1553.t1